MLKKRYYNILCHFTTCGSCNFRDYFTCATQTFKSIMSNLNDENSWSGVSLCEIYGSQSPWRAPEFPLIRPTFNHTVLYDVSIQSNDQPPKAHPGQDKWDGDHVRMPCSSQSLYPVRQDNGEMVLKKRWDLIEEALQKPLKTSEDLACAILSYNSKFITIWKFGALHKLFNEYLEEEESEYFFNVTLPEIVKLTLALPKLIQSPIPLLKQHKNKAVSLSQQQIASLLANAFFCTFPRRNSFKRESEYGSYPFINFNMLYESVESDQVLEKLKCICHYFRRVSTRVPVGVMTFLRHSVPPEKCPNWSKSEKFVGGTPLHVDSTGTIEDADGLIQVDFANKFLGGGVLRRGCVQEEIRFVICPELLISMLFTEVLDRTESLLIIGCERYSKYVGYGNSFQWAGNYIDKTPFDSSQRRRTTVLAIDAYPFRKKLMQYESEAILRELNKAWVGVSTYISDEDKSRLMYPGVATGNWGCGAFGGNAHLKSLLQLMACTEAKRPMAYYTFEDVQLKKDFIKMYNVLSKHNVTVSQLYDYITKYIPSKGSVPGKKIKVLETELHSYLLEIIEGVTEMELTEEFVSPFKKSDFSPDLFEEEEDILLDDTIFDNVAEESLNKTSDKCKVHSTNEISNESMSKSPNLFDEMTNFDNKNGELNLSKQSRISFSGLNDSPKVKDGSASSRVTDETNDMSPLGQKRKLGKKITDYFHKRPI